MFFSHAVPNGGTGNPLLRPSSVILCMLSLSIGWGIRGNFGHTEGAMMPGALCAIAVCLFSGREDWRARMPFFAVFGALGWAFGGCIAYMPALSYTQSGDLRTQFYGYFTCFAVGSLWASLGGGGTAYAAVETEERITAFFRPLCWLLAFWTIQYFWEDRLMIWYQGADADDFRQRNHFYWLDTSWMTALLAALSACAFDLWTRRFGTAWMLAAWSGGGALAGFLVQRGLEAMGWLKPLLQMLVHPQGDLIVIDSATGRPFDASYLVTNWPQLFADLSSHMGWIIGLAIGVASYFWRHGEWKDGSALILNMSVGGLLVFLAGPVLLSNAFGDMGGFRMMPPRADDWALVIGMLLGFLRYAFRNGLRPVAFVALVSGTMGGLSLMLAQFLKTLMFMPGNPRLTSDPAVIQAWSHWHQANWHSIMTEQGVGLLYGLSIVLPMAALAARIPLQVPKLYRLRWTQAFAVMFVLGIIVYPNMVRNVADWTRVREGGFVSIPAVMKAPWVGAIQMTTTGWFNLGFLFYAICLIVLLTRHLNQPLSVVPESWLGKGQLLYLVFLWIIVVMNFERAVVWFHEERLATEGTIFLNALIATLMILAMARRRENIEIVSFPLRPKLMRVLAAGAALFFVMDIAFTSIVHGVYGNQGDGWSDPQVRFGPKAEWRLHPTVTNREHP